MTQSEAYQTIKQIVGQDRIFEHCLNPEVAAAMATLAGECKNDGTANMTGDSFLRQWSNA